MIIYNESNERHQNEFFTKQLHINININMFTHKRIYNKGDNIL